MNVHQFSTAEETVYGTPVVTERFNEIMPGESLGRSNKVLQSNGLRPGIRSKLGSRRVLTGRQGSGSISMEVMTTTFGRWFEYMLGGTGTVAQQAATAAYLHTYIPGTMLGKSLTIQKGVEKTGGAAQAFTFHGCKIVSWEISISKDGICMLNLDIDAEDVDDTTALAAASYATGMKVFHFAQATLKKDGGAAIATVSDVSIKGTNSFDIDRFFLGTAGVKSEPLETDYRTYSGDVTAEFADVTTFHNAFEADTSLQLELEFVGDVIEGAYSETLTITVEDVRLTGETPKITGPEPAIQNVPWEGYETDAGLSVKIEYMTTDTAV